MTERRKKRPFATRWSKLPCALGVILLTWIKLMLPVQSPLQKYFHSLLTQITCISFAIPAHTRGVSRSSRT